MNGTDANGEDGEYHRETVIKLVTACTAQWIEETSVKILNVEETAQGHDIVTFRCPLCLGEHMSLRYA